MVLQFAAAAAPMFAEALPALTAAGGTSASGTGAGLMSQGGGGLGGLISSLLGKGGSSSKEKKPSEQDQLLKLLGGMSNPAASLANQGQFSIPGSPMLGGMR